MPKQTRLLRIRWLLAAAFVCGCSVSAQPENPVIASSDSVSLRASDVRSFLQTLDDGSRREAQKNPQVLMRLLRQELGRRALLQQAQAQKWDQRPEVAAQIERARNDALLNSYLQSVAAPPPTFPSDAELQEAYRLNQQRFLTPRSYHIAQIFVAVVDPSADAAAQTKIKKLGAQLRSTPDRFADLARSESDDKSSAAQGGDVGWLTEAQLVPELRSAVQGLGKGEVSEPLKVGGGWHLLRLIDTRAAATQPFDQVKTELTTLLRQQRAQRDAADYVNKLLGEQHAAVDEIGMRKIIGAASDAAPAQSQQ